MLSRKKMIKILASLPLVGGLAGSALTSQNDYNKGPNSTKYQNLFSELGIQPLINARGTMTYLSGSLMLPEVVQAINSTSHEFANMYEVQDAVGKRIAELLNCEAAMVTSGAAGAITIGTAAAITGKDQKKIDQLPNLPGPRPEVIIQKEHRYVFDQAARMTGIKLVEVKGPKEMEEAINENTVMALFFNAASSWYGIDEYSISREEFIAIGRKYDIPTFNDAAADVTPVENLFKYQEMGFDMVTFSGGKMLRGPQSAGILLGRKDLIEAAKLNFNPHESPIGRPMKVNKEEMFGMLVALEDFLERDHEKEWQEWIGRTKYIADKVETVPTVKGKTEVNEGPANYFPGLKVSWDQSRVKITPEETVKELREGYPRIETSGNDEGLNISVVTLKPEQVDIVGQRIKEVLEQAV
ncbi:aminotransferase class V-fold PLP-dependent enzyme [Halalkalibaculum sp. DA384]|uniref:aminotransferase class V-fold PLP-dependent enzyme n=1 Tax=Halalkalibaculum sp. DA384 TaxID=3373606 RepID=UPI00375405E9